MADNGRGGREITFVQIQCVPVRSTPYTQCDAMMFGVDGDGKMWWKRDDDDVWRHVSMQAASEPSGEIQLLPAMS